MNNLSAYYEIKPDVVNSKIASVKRAQLKKEFIISKSALYDYYSTNSGIFAANPSIGSSGDSGGEDDEDDQKQQIQQLKNQVDNINTNVSNAAAIVEPIMTDVNDYENVNDIISATITVRNAVHTLSVNVNN